LASSAVIVPLDGLTVRDARIALGGAGTKPWRAKHAETALIGQTADTEAFSGAAAMELEGARSYGQNGFKIALGQQSIVRNLSTLTD
jgi:xanthine dehydrogenase YagS FAD-binding subunit